MPIGEARFVNSTQIKKSRTFKFYNFFSQMYQKNLNTFKIQHTRSLSPPPPPQHTHTPTRTHARENATRTLQRNNLEEMFLILACKMQMQPQRHETFLVHIHTHTPTRTHKQHTNNKVSMQFLIPLSSPLHMQTAKKL